MAMKPAAGAVAITEARYKIYCDLFTELSHTRY
jgi:hypothetical protein